MTTPIGSYNVCGWVQGGERVTFMEGLSYDAARHIAQVHAGMGEATRIHCETEGVDYCEAYCPHGSVRKGKFAEVLLVASVPTHDLVTICCEAVIMQPGKVAAA